MGKGSSGGGGQQTVVQQSQPPQAFLNAYSNVVGQAQNVAGQPYQQYGGQLLAPFNAYQNLALQNSPTSAQNWVPYNTSAYNLFQQAGTPISATPFNSSTLQPYLSPYTQQVTGALQNLFNQQNATQLQQVRGNAAAQGAFGGDREAVAEAQTAGQQQAQEQPVLANVLQQGYNTALGEFNAQQQANLQAQQATGWLRQGAGYGVGNLGMENFNIDQGTLNQLMQFGNQAQQQSQQALNIPYEQFIAQQSYPFQTTGWLANIAEGLGGASGGTSSTSYPGPSPLSQVAGLGLAGTGIIGATGGFGSNGWLTGAGGLLGAGAGAADLGLGNAVMATGVSSAADIAAGAPLLLAAHGGRIRRQGGGQIPISPLAVPGIAASPTMPGTTAPLTMPNMSAGYVPSATASPMQRTMPTPPNVPEAGQQPSPITQGLQALQLANSIKGIAPTSEAFGGSVTPLTAYQGFQDGGAATMGAGAAMTGGAGMSPFTAGLLQQYLQLPAEKLQELAVMVPPSTPRGQMVQRALQMKHMNPGTPVSGMGAPQPATSPMAGALQMPPPVSSAPPPAAGVLGQYRGGRTRLQDGGSPDWSGPLAIPIFNYLNALSNREPPDPTIPAAQSGIPEGSETRGGPQPPRAFVQSGNPEGSEPATSGFSSSALSTQVPLAQPSADVSINTIAPAPRNGSVLPMGPTRTPPTAAPGQFAPGFARNSQGEITRNGQPPDVMLPGGVPGWDAGLVPPTLRRIYGPESGGNYHAQNPTSTASGVGQEIHGTWREAMVGLGFDPDRWANAKDAPQQVQDNANSFLLGKYGANSSHTWATTAGKRGAPPVLTGMPGEEFGPVSGGSSGAATQPPLQMPPERPMPEPSASDKFMSSPWMPLISIGAGMMASRSPYPGVALGEGLETGIRVGETQQSKEYQNELAQVRNQSAADKANYMFDMAMNARDRTNETAAHHSAQEAQAESNAASLAQSRDAAESARLQSLGLAESNLDLRRQNAGRWEATMGPDPNDPSKQVAGYTFFANDPNTSPRFVPGYARQPTGAGGHMSDEQVNARAHDMATKEMSGILNNIQSPDFNRIAKMTQPQRDQWLAERQTHYAQVIRGQGVAAAATAPRNAAPPLPPSLQGQAGLGWNAQTQQFYNPATKQIYDLNGNPVQ